LIPVASAASAADVEGKTVYGNLPLRLAALAREVYAVEFAGSPPRGQEYSLDAMLEAGAKLTRYVVTTMPQIEYDEIDVGWLDTLIASYMRIREQDPDYLEDVAAGWEMMAYCRRLADQLRAALPQPEPEPAAVVDPDMPF
jgi:hypothetical protein